MGVRIKIKIPAVDIRSLSNFFLDAERESRIRRWVERYREGEFKVSSIGHDTHLLLAEIDALRGALADCGTPDEEAKIDENLERLKEATARTGKVDQSIRVNATADAPPEPTDEMVELREAVDAVDPNDPFFGTTHDETAKTSESTICLYDCDFRHGAGHEAHCKVNRLRAALAAAQPDNHPSHDFHSTSESDGECTECGAGCDTDKARQQCAAQPDGRVDE